MIWAKMANNKNVNDNARIFVLVLDEPKSMAIAAERVMKKLIKPPEEINNLFSALDNVYNP